MTIKKFGFIYKVYHKDFPEEFYIGSTNDVKKREWEHKSGYKGYLNGKCLFNSIYSIFKKYENLDDIVFETIDCIEYEVKEERDTTPLKMLENEYIKIIFPECVNIYRAYVVESEYREEYRKINKDKINESGRRYYQNNKGVISKKQKEKVKCSICGKEISRSNVSYHLKIHNK